MNLQKARLEFKILIDRCACSRAYCEVTKEEAEAWSVEPCIPSCTPKKCFPELYSLLYPKGGLHQVSHLVQQYRKRKQK